MTPSVMVVEDDPLLRENLRFVLQLADYQVVEVGNAFEGLQALRQGDVLPDLILADILLPGMSGFDLLEAVRAEPKWRKIPVVFLSGRDEREYLNHATELGVDSYVTKPFRTTDLLSVIQRLLGSSTSDV